MTSSSFDSTGAPLQELLARADKGALQLPDFQRGRVRDDDRIRGLLASVPVSYPIGAEKMDEILRAQRFAPEHLRADRSWESFAARAESLLRRIEVATGKTTAREPALFRAGVMADAYDEGPEEWDAEEPLEESAS